MAAPAGQTARAGGTGTGLEVLINGVDQGLSAQVTDTVIAVNSFGVGAAVAGEFVSLAVLSGGLFSNGVLLEVVV